MPSLLALYYYHLFCFASLAGQHEQFWEVGFAGSDHSAPKDLLGVETNAPGAP